MHVSEIGEFELIRLLAREIGVDYPPVPGKTSQSGMLVGLGDDAVVTPSRTGAMVWTTDTMVADVHFTPGLTAWQDVGWKALAVNVSDVAAMGAEPYLALITLALPADFVVEDAQSLYRGLFDCATAFNVTLGGGDIVRSPVFSVTVALSGWAYSERLGQPRVMTRSTAKKGDIVAVSGTLGDSAGGLRVLQGGAEAHETLRLAHERPQPRVVLGHAAVRAGVHCAIDVSDGLVQDLGHVARASGVWIRIDAARVPVSDALALVCGEEALGLALSGGEDYELVLIGRRPVIESLMSATDIPLTQIGEVVSDGEAHVAVVDEAGMELPQARGGWDHFGKA